MGELVLLAVREHKGRDGKELRRGLQVIWEKAQHHPLRVFVAAPGEIGHILPPGEPLLAKGGLGLIQEAQEAEPLAGQLDGVLQTGGEKVLFRCHGLFKSRGRCFPARPTHRRR